MKQQVIGIYKVISPSGKVYIGQSIDIKGRWSSHYSNKNIGPKLKNSYEKHGTKNHKFEIIEECSLEQLNEKEIYYKKIELDKVNGDWSKVLFCELYDRGGGPKSEETKLKQSKALKGRIISEETKQKMRKCKSFNPKRKPRSKESIKRQSLSRTGKLHSNKTKQKMSISQKGKSRNKGHVLSEIHKIKLSESIKKAKAKI